MTVSDMLRMGAMMCRRAVRVVDKCILQPHRTRASRFPQLGRGAAPNGSHLNLSHIAIAPYPGKWDRQAEAMYSSVRVYERLGFLCASVLIAWLDFVEPIRSYLTLDERGWLPNTALAFSVSASLLGADARSLRFGGNRQSAMRLSAQSWLAAIHVI